MVALNALQGKSPGPESIVNRCVAAAEQEISVLVEPSSFRDLGV
jgi:hypothetical protein